MLKSINWLILLLRISAANTFNWRSNMPVQIGPETLYATVTHGKHLNVNLRWNKLCEINRMDDLQPLTNKKICVKIYLLLKTASRKTVDLVIILLCFYGKDIYVYEHVCMNPYVFISVRKRFTMVHSRLSTVVTPENRDCVAKTDWLFQSISFVRFSFYNKHVLDL